MIEIIIRIVETVVLGIVPIIVTVKAMKEMKES